MKGIVNPNKVKDVRQQRFQKDSVKAEQQPLTAEAKAALREARFS